MSAHGAGANIKARLYLEGRYIANGMSTIMVTGGAGAPATAQVNLTPTNSIKHILPGTWIHIFVTDPWNPAPKGDLSDYILLFEGVVVARGFSREGEGRSFSIQCAHPSVYWAEAKQFWINLSSAGGGIVDQLALQTSGGYGRFTMLESTGVYGYALSRLTSQQDQGEERFLDTMLSVIDDIGNVNPFYTNVRNRLRLTDRVIRGPAGNTEKLFQLNLLGDFLNGLAQRSSGQTNLAEVVNMLLSAILHEWVSVVAPPFIKTRIFKRDVFGNIRRNKTTVVRDDKYGNRKVDLYTFETATDNVIADTIFKPHVYTLSPPSCNVLFPNMYDRTGFQDSFLAEPTRLVMRPHLITQSLEKANTFGLMFMRPTELEIFTAITRDDASQTRGKRTPDAKFSDGEGQAPNFHDYDWTTNEERIRGLVYDNIDMGPAPSTLTLTDPGKRQPDGSRKGGMPKYLQNVASYEYYKAKFVARQTQFSGPFNPRPVPGFPMLALDDSAANLNIVCNLSTITHSIDCNGSATTQYGVEYPRLADEVDLNRPRFKGGVTAGGELDLDLIRDENGKFQFEKVFDGLNRPPIPEWFSDDFKTLIGLDNTYSSWFGDNVRVLESILFNDPKAAALTAAQRASASSLATQAAASSSVLTRTAGEVAVATASAAASVATLEANNSIDQLDAVKALVARYISWRESGREFMEAGKFTNRNFTRIDEAFRFSGAAPLEMIDNEATTVFLKDVDYATNRLDNFVGVTAPGYGYAAEQTTEQVQPAQASVTTPAGTSTVAAKPIPTSMSAAFPVFDTKIHRNAEATDAKVRADLMKTESASSNWPRYDGRPQMFDFEFRLWQKSLSDAGYAPDGQKIAIANMTPHQQAPTGDSTEGSEKKPLPQPLSEHQVVELRRAIIDAYREELEKSRGFTG